MPVAHTLVAADAERVATFARLWGALERAVADDALDGPAARSAHARVSVAIDRWILADLEAERRDVVALTDDDREELRRSTARAIAHGEADVAHALQAIEAAFPAALPRATLVRLRRSAERLARVERLGGPAFVLGGEARVMRGAFQLARMPLVPAPIGFDPNNGFHDTLLRGLEACVIEAPGATGGADLGLGTSAQVATLLGTDDVDASHRAWLDTAAASHPFARYPLVPRGRLCRVTATRLVRADLDGTGPIGWAAGDDVVALAEALRALGVAADGIAAAAARGLAVIGLIEYLPREAEGERQWLSEA